MEFTITRSHPARESILVRLAGLLTSCWNGSGVNTINVFRITGNSLFSTAVPGWTAWNIPCWRAAVGIDQDTGCRRRPVAVLRSIRIIGSTRATRSRHHSPTAPLTTWASTQPTYQDVGCDHVESAIDFYYPAVTVTSVGKRGNCCQFLVPLH
jgi:hypothetical protein